LLQTYTMKTQQEFKILSESLCAFTLIIVFSLPLHIAYADSCIPPTPRVCYSTVSSQEPVGELPDGSIVVQTSQTQVQTSCAGTQQEIDYEVQETSYNVCEEINATTQEEANPDNVSEVLGSSTADNLNCMKLGAWYVYNESSKTCVDTETSESNPFVFLITGQIAILIKRRKNVNAKVASVLISMQQVPH
jgi:hypothetical protein